jgi:hypothetical protein
MCRSQLMLVVNQCSNQKISAMNQIISDSIAYAISLNKALLMKTEIENNMN